MLAKWKIELVSFLSSLSLVSVGFSAWNISYTVPVIETINGSLQTDYVLKTDDYVYFSKDDSKDTDDGIILPQYNEKGFLIPDSEIDGGLKASNSATITLYLTIDYDVCMSQDSALSKNEEKYLHIDCEISLKNDSEEFFNDYLTKFYRDTGEYTFNENTGYIISSAGKKTGYRVFIQNFPLESLTKNRVIEIKIDLETESPVDIYRILSANNNYFIFSTEVHGTKEEIKPKN